MSAVVFKTKTIDFNGKRNILIQNENGPCALLALVNTILLTVTTSSSPEIQNLVVLVNSKEEVLLDEVCQFISNILVSNQKLHHLPPEDVQTSLSILPHLHKGLNINPKFDGTFGESQELSIFRCLNISLLHGWLIDPSDFEYQSVIKHNSYEASQNVLVEAYEIQEKQNRDAVDQEILNDAQAIKSFFARTATQLTDYGLQYLKHILQPHSVGILFRNDHFATVVKNDSDLFFLITDTGFARRPDFVWESLLSINGANNSFFTGNFTPLLEDSSNPFADDANQADITSQEETDRALALAIQEEEDNRAATNLQRSYADTNPSQNNRNKPKKDKKFSTSGLTSKLKKDKDKCIIT